MLACLWAGATSVVQPREVSLVDDFPSSSLEKIAKVQLRTMPEAGHA